MLPTQDLFSYAKQFARISLTVIGWALLIIFGRAAIGQVSDWQQVNGVTERQIVGVINLNSQSTPFFNTINSNAFRQEYLNERSNHDETAIQAGNSSTSRKKTDQVFYKKQAKENVAALKPTSLSRLN